MTSFPAGFFADAAFLIAANYGQAIQCAPTHSVYWSNRANAYAHLGRWDRVADDLAKTIELGDDGIKPWSNLAIARLANNDTDGYRQACATMLERIGNEDENVALNRAVEACVLARDSLTDLSKPLALARELVDRRPAKVFSQRALGMALYRAGRLQESVEHLATAERLMQDPEATQGFKIQMPTKTWYFLAMAHHDLGNKAEAETWYEKAEQWSDKNRDSKEIGWPNRLQQQLLRAEVDRKQMKK